MTFWLLYLALDGQFLPDPHIYHFAYKENCAKVGEEFVKKYKYEKYKCVMEKRE